jgi:hypothetical protein
MTKKDIANIMVNRIVADLTDRRGLRQEWEAIDSEVQSEIEETWMKIIETTLTECTEKMSNKETKMKCLCGYEHESGLDKDANYKENLLGDEPFSRIQGSTFKKYLGMGETNEIYLYICPKCGTIKTEI